MNKKQTNSASALQITLVSICAVLLTFGAAPARNQFKQKSATADVAVQNAHRHAALSESVARKRTNTRKSERVEFSASRQQVGGREISGFSAQIALEENLTPPAGLKPVEQEAWLAMAHRHGANGLTSFYPSRYGDSFVVEGGGVRVAVRPVGGMDAPWQASNTIQNRGNVWIVQNPLPCLPCTLEGCERHIGSGSVCLQELAAEQVLAAADEALGKGR